MIDHYQSLSVTVLVELGMVVDLVSVSIMDRDIFLERGGRGGELGIEIFLYVHYVGLSSQLCLDLD